MTLRRIVALPLLLTFALSAFAQDAKQALNEQLWEAARKGDAAAVRALLDKGADVNAKFRYGQTPLFKAAERGHTEVVRVLLERGADVNAKDTFYSATPVTWALMNKHTEVVRALLDKGSEAAGEVLSEGVSGGDMALVTAALAHKDKLTPEALTVALVSASGDEKKAEIVELLKKAGAQPPFEVDAATLATYAGKYRGDPGPEVNVSVKDGKLFATTATRGTYALMALDKTTFRPVAFDGVTFTFNVEGGKATGIALKQGPNTTQLKRVEQ